VHRGDIARDFAYAGEQLLVGVDRELRDARRRLGECDATEGKAYIHGRRPSPELVEAFAAARAVLDAIAATVYELGERAGIGSRIKTVNQLLAGVHIAAACEAIAFAIRMGVDPAVAYDVITHSAGNSWMFENRIPHVLKGDYTPHSAIDIFVKDLGIVLDQGRDARFPLPMTAAAHQLYLAAAAMGFGRDDDASIARVFAELGKITLP